MHTKITTSFLKPFKLIFMKSNFLLLSIFLIAASSCSTSYKTGQTPDDVYYSPARLQTNEVRREKNKDRDVYNNSSVYTSAEDRMIRRRHNGRYRRYDDRYGYDNPYGYNNSYGYPVYVDPKTGATQNTSQPRKTNLGGYKQNTTVSTDSVKTYDPKLGNQNTGTTINPVRTFDKSSTKNKGTVVGNAIRNIINNSTGNSADAYNSGNSNNTSTSRSFERSSSNNNSSSNSSTNSNSSSSNKSSSPATSVPVRTFKNDN
jgi:hypothetical protein